MELPQQNEFIKNLNNKNEMQLNQIILLEKEINEIKNKHMINPGFET